MKSTCARNGQTTSNHHCKIIVSRASLRGVLGFVLLSPTWALIGLGVLLESSDSKDENQGHGNTKLPPHHFHTPSLVLAHEVLMVRQHAFSTAIAPATCGPRSPFSKRQFSRMRGFLSIAPIAKHRWGILTVIKPSRYRLALCGAGVDGGGTLLRFLPNRPV